MSKAVLISIRPQWCELIANGKKTVEVRKTIPKLGTPFTCYIYCTKGNLSYPVENGMVCHNSGGMVAIGEFVCDDIIEDLRGENCDILCGQGYMSLAQIKAYGRNKKLYGWHISDLKIYDAPKDLNEFWLPPELYCEKERCGGCPYDQVADVNGEYSFDCEWKRPLTRPPQSWCYVEDKET